MITVQPIPTAKDIYKMLSHDVRTFMLKVHPSRYDRDAVHNLVMDKIIYTTRPYISSQFHLSTRDRLFLYLTNLAMNRYDADVRSAYGISDNY